MDADARPDCNRGSQGGCLRAAVIGTGKISEEHLRYLAGDAQILMVGVRDLSPALARFAAERFGAAASFADVAQMLREVRPDVVHVLTPPRSHPAIIRQCLAAGAHVIVEKPIALSHGEFRELHDLAERRGRRLIEDHNYRFNAPVLRLDRLVRQGELGTIREVQVRMDLAVRGPGSRYADPHLPHPSHGLPAGVIHEFITHLCYLALRFLPGEVSAVRANWANRGGPACGFRYDDLDATAYSRDARASIRFSADAAPDSFTIILRGDAGTAATDLFHPHLLVQRRGSALGPAGALIDQLRNGVGLVAAGMRGFSDKLLQRTAYEGMATFLKLTYAALRAGTMPPVTFDDMDRASRLIDGLVAQAGADAPQERAA